MAKLLSGGYFSINGILTLNAILPPDVSDWSVLMMYHIKCDFWSFLIGQFQWQIKKIASPRYILPHCTPFCTFTYQTPSSVYCLCLNTLSVKIPIHSMTRQMHYPTTLQHYRQNYQIFLFKHT